MKADDSAAGGGDHWEQWEDEQYGTKREQDDGTARDTEAAESMPPCIKP